MLCEVSDFPFPAEGLMERDPQQKRQDVDHVFLRFGRRYGFY